MKTKELTQVAGKIQNFLTEHNISHDGIEIYIEHEWVDFCFTISDRDQISRLATWLLPDLRGILGTYSGVEIVCPVPIPEKSNVLRVRVLTVS